MSTNLGHGLQEKSKFLHISKNLHFPQVLKSVLRNPFQYRNVVIYLKRSCSFWLIFFRIRGAALTSPKIFIFELGPNGTTFMGVYCLLNSKDWVIELDTNLEAHRFGVYRSIFKFNIILEMARGIFYNTNQLRTLRTL